MRMIRYFLHLVLYPQLSEEKLLAKVNGYYAGDCIRSQSLAEHPA